MKKLFKTILKTMMGTLALYVALCCIEILVKHLFGGSTYSDYNIITNAMHFIKHIDKHIFNFKFFMGV